MAAYILRRLLLIIPTLFGIMLVNFALVQFVPGGPIAQIIARVQGEGDALANVSGGDAGGGGMQYAGAQGLPPEFLDELETQMGFAEIVCDPGHEGAPDLKSEDCRKEPIGMARRFAIMMGNYLTFDFGDSWFRSGSVTSEILKALPVSITLGLWSTLLAYLISIPLGIRKAVRDGTPFDSWTSGIIIVAYAIPSFLFAVLLMTLFAGGTYWKIFPLRGLTSPDFDSLSTFGQIKDYLWHIVLPVASISISGFATLTLLTKNSFLDEINKQYVMTARAKGLTERRVLYGHVFRNAMLIVIAGLPAMLLAILFGSSILIETIFSLPGLGRLGFDAAVQRDYPLVFGTLFIFGLMGLLIGILSDLMYVLVDPRIDFEKRAG
ncbi:MAG: microcin C ABC transporter permease YejB [Paracoccus sp. (in: a-proteobacteria)]